MEGSPPRKKVTELTFEDMFLSKLQRHLHNNDMEGALRAVREHEQASVVYPGEARRIDKAKDHLHKEKMTEEAYRLPTFNTLEEAKEAFKDTPEAKKRKLEKRLKLQKKVEQLQNRDKEIKVLIEKVRSKEKSSRNDEILLQLQKLEAVNKVGLKAAMQELIESLQDMIKRQKFIEENPKMFLRKKYFTEDQFGLERAKARMKYLGDGQVVIIGDKFSTAMPESLKKKCVNPEQFTNAHEFMPQKHGIAVASVVVDDKHGVAPKAKFRAQDTIRREFYSLRGPFKEQPSPGRLQLLTVEGKNLSTYDLKVLEILIKHKQTEFACLIDGEYFIVEIISPDTFPEMIVNMSTNFWDSIDQDRSENPNCRLAHLLGYAAMIQIWIRQGKVIVWAAGNEGTTVGASEAYLILRKFSEVYPNSFIVALSLENDHMALSDFTNQPGDHPIKDISLCAPGDDVTVMSPDGMYRVSSGTSYSAPFITGAAALLASNYPKATGPQIISALLGSAVPVVMRKSPNRRYESPYAIRSARSKDLAPGVHVYKKADGKRFGKIIVTEEMIKRGREKYGAGIINISGALRALEEIYGPIKSI